MKFNIDNYKGNYVMHCDTKEEAKDFCEYMHIIGKRWNGGGSYSEETHWEIHGRKTVYYFNNNTYGHMEYIENNFTILEWSDFMEFTKSNLKTGDVILRRDGGVEILNRELGAFICKNGGWNSLNDIREDLTCGFGQKPWDIIEVRRPKNPCDCCFDAMGINRRGTLVYERKEIEEMTLAEVCRLLGKEIKIVK
jgi:hypothetical protein